MTDKSFNSSAVASMRGDTYQFYYALFLMLNELDESKNYGAIRNISVRLEGEDDIELSENGKIYKLVQTKHLTQKNILRNHSTEFWKTIRIWSEFILNQTESVDNVIFSFVTTTDSSKGHVLDLLNNKKTDEALNKMDNFITNSRSRAEKKKESNSNQTEKLSDNEEAFRAFEKLGFSDRKKQLLNAIEIKLSAPNLEQIEEKIKNWLITYVPSERVNACFSELKGWWESINDSNFPKIGLSEINNQIQDLAHKYHRSELPVLYEGKKVELPNDYEDQNFVKQLKNLKYTTEIEIAKQDFYKTQLERSRWENDMRCISPDDIIEYEKTLIVEGWKREQSSVHENFKFELDVEKIEDITEEKTLQKIGRKVYESTRNNYIPFKSITAKYFMYGSYHELANQTPPKVYWHPKFLESLKNEDEKC